MEFLVKNKNPAMTSKMHLALFSLSIKVSIYGREGRIAMGIENLELLILFASHFFADEETKLMN